MIADDKRVNVVHKKIKWNLELCKFQNRRRIILYTCNEQNIKYCIGNPSDIFENCIMTRVANNIDIFGLVFSNTKEMAGANKNMYKL